MVRLGTKSIAEGIRLLDELYADKADEMVEAWDNTEADDGITVSMSVKFTPAKKNEHAIDVDVSCSFVKEKVKVTESAQVIEKQGELFNAGEKNMTLTTGNGETTGPFSVSDMRRARKVIKKYGLDREKKMEKAVEATP